MLYLKGEIRMIKTVIAILLAVALCISTVGCASVGPSVSHRSQVSAVQYASASKSVNNHSAKTVAINDALNFANGGVAEASDVLIFGGLILVGGFVLMLYLLSNFGNGSTQGGM